MFARRAPEYPTRSDRRIARGHFAVARKIVLLCSSWPTTGSHVLGLERKPAAAAQRPAGPDGVVAAAGLPTAGGGTARELFQTRDVSRMRLSVVSMASDETSARVKRSGPSAARPIDEQRADGGKELREDQQRQKRRQ